MLKALFVLLLVLAPLHARAAGEFNGVWRQLAVGDSGTWSRLGVIAIEINDKGIYVAPIRPTFYRRNLLVPGAIYDQKLADMSLRFRGKVTGQKDDKGNDVVTVLEFTLTPDGPDRLVGTVSIQNVTQKIRLERLPTQAEQVREFKAIAVDVAAEAKVTQRRLEALKASHEFWQQQIAADRKNGRNLSGTMTALCAAMAEGNLTREQSRLKQLEAYATQLEKLIAGLGAD